VDVWKHIGRFLEYDRGRRPSMKKYSWMCKRILGRMRETKVTDTELSWLYSALIARQPIDPFQLGSGCYLSMLATSLRPTIPRNLEHLLAGTSLGFDYMKKEKYKSEDERGGVKVAKVNLPLS
jgi:hypothetical protein